MWSIRVTDENGEVFVPRSFENHSDDDVVELLIAAELMYPQWQMELVESS
jgi:hypothetical protein